MHWKLFEELYENFAKRQATERVMRLKECMITGLWGNSIYDENKGARDRALEDIDAKFEMVVEEIWLGKKAHEIDKTDPFFAAMKVPKLDDPGPNAQEIEKGMKPEDLESIDQL